MKYKKVVGWIEIVGSIIMLIFGQGLGFFIDRLEGDPFVWGSDEIHLIFAIISILFILQGIINIKKE